MLPAPRDAETCSQYGAAGTAGEAGGRASISALGTLAVGQVVGDLLAA
jgi:hypothetical protein